MKQKFYLKLLAGLFVCLGAFVACDDSDDEMNRPNSLKVNPETPSITFDADGSQEIVLTVTTDAPKWEIAKAEWIVATIKENKLTLSAKANTSEQMRVGRITITAGTAQPLKISVSQKGIEEGETVLSVSPRKLAFEATGNAPKELTVTTNADDWDFTYPQEWLTVTKKGNDRLTVTVSDNEDEANIGQIVITAGEKSVRVAVTQKAQEETPEPIVKVTGTLSTDETTEFALKNEAITKQLKFTLAQASDTEVQIRIAVNEKYVEEYNYLNNTEHMPLSASSVDMADGGLITIPAGSTDGSIAITFRPAISLNPNKTYMAPIRATAESDNVTIPTDNAYVNFFIDPEVLKSVKQLVCIETNDTNPLNALEYVLEDGQMFFDAVVLFSGNLRYDPNSEKPKLYYNQGIQELLDRTDELLQPLRQKGIKVLMGLLGDHDGVGPANLKPLGQEELAQQIVDMCIEYKLDGIFVDDEYAKYAEVPRVSDYLSGSRTSKQYACDFLEVTKRYMTEQVSWPTLCTVFLYGTYWQGVSKASNGRMPAEFVDMTCSNYGGAGWIEGEVKANCAMESIECNLGSGGLSEETARKRKEEGYGWCMWFALDPVQGWEPTNKMQEISRGCYDQGLRDRTGYYKRYKGTDIQTYGCRYDTKRYTVQ